MHQYAKSQNKHNLYFKADNYFDALRGFYEIQTQRVEDTGVIKLIPPPPYRVERKGLLRGTQRVKKHLIQQISQNGGLSCHVTFKNKMQFKVVVSPSTMS